MMGGYENYLIALLSPLGIYDFREGALGESELYALGGGLDEAALRMETVEREAVLSTAEEEGLRRREALFAQKPAAATAALRRAAIAALCRIDGDGLTVEAINRTISGCGIRAKANETETPGRIRVIFPEVAGKPDQIDQIQKIILEIIPCHLETEFYFRYLRWQECEQRGLTWADVENAAHTWHSFELDVLPEE